jgi:pimeloyl-ACP methyl ester carboxylesterase
MASTYQERLIQNLSTCWHGPYRMPIIFTSCTALLIAPYAWKKLTYKPNLLPPPPKDFNHQLVKLAYEGSASFTLPDGKKLGYAQYGDPNGKPIIALHGMLGSRIENAYMDADAKDLGIRIIGVDRPGIGWSSPDPRPISQRKSVDFARDVEALAEHLNLKEYAVLGISAGGSYALGSAASLPSSQSKPKLKAVSIVTGLGLPDMSSPFPAAVTWLYKNVDIRWAMKYIFTRGDVWNMSLSDPEREKAYYEGFDLNHAHPADIETTKRPDHPDMVRLFLAFTREATVQGLQGFEDDAYLLARDPGFKLEDIPKDLPVQLWYGDADTNVSPKAGEETAERLRASGHGKVELHMEAGHTHGSTQVVFRRRYLEDLKKAMGG